MSFEYIQMPAALRELESAAQAVSSVTNQDTSSERDEAAQQQPQGQAVSDEQIEKLAHRTCSRYRHDTHPSYVEYTFQRHTLGDFVRAILALRDKPAPTLINGLTEAETSASASVSGLVQRVPLSNCAWEVRIAGPDDVHTLDTEIDALRQANEVNKAFVAHECAAAIRALAEGVRK